MRFLLLTFATACAFSLSCERHEFDGAGGTKQLHQSHGPHNPDNASHNPKPTVAY
jgi:hypothetical protein